MMKQDEKNSSSSAKGKFKYTPQENGAHVDKSYGKNMGQPMQKIIGTEEVKAPFGEKK